MPGIDKVKYALDKYLVLAVLGGLLLLSLKQHDELRKITKTILINQGEIIKVETSLVQYEKDQSKLLTDLKIHYSEDTNKFNGLYFGKYKCKP